VNQLWTRSGFSKEWRLGSQRSQDSQVASLRTHATAMPGVLPAALPVSRNHLGVTSPAKGSGADSVGTRLEHVHEHEHEHKGFDDEAATWDDDPGHEKRQVAVAQAIEQTVNLSPQMSAIDVGGGTGRLSILLADRIGSVVVTDPSAGMVQVARERIEAAGLGDRLRAVQADLTIDRLEGAYDVVWSSMALHHVQDLDALLRSVAGLLVDGGQLAIADLDEDPDGAFHADKIDFDGHDGFNRERLAEQLTRAGFADVSFVDATTILKNDREFGLFLCTATKAPERSGDH
jgi:SAM-dependent methyltransferase